MKQEMSEFLKFAYEQKKINDIEKAFKDYPVEEEWHKGRTENLLSVCEDEEEYSIYEIGDSIVKTDVLYKINTDNILFKIGEVDKKRIEEYKNNFIKLNK